MGLSQDDREFSNNTGHLSLNEEWITTHHTSAHNFLALTVYGNNDREQDCFTDENGVV